MKSFLTLFLIFCSGILYGQSMAVSGVVSDKTGPLPGVNVLIKGTTLGTVSDMDGRFSINASKGDVLVFSSIALETVEILLEDKTFLNVTLIEDVELLGEVVVTALGITRDTKALGYAVSKVDGGDIAQFSKVSPIEALSGQVAGLNISGSGSGAGGSSKVTIRGVSSLTGSNEPLYVIDGIPMDNSGGASGAQYGGTDYGSAANNINPDDIASISVLKGGAAAALYGSRGQNGVIMISTKKGSQKDELMGISYGFQTQLSLPMEVPDFQESYSQGSAGKFMATDSRSWGAKMQGQEVTNFLGQKQALVSVENPYHEYLQMGVSNNHSLAINNRGEKAGVYFSFTNTEDKGLIPGNKIDKNSLMMRFDTELGGVITLDAKANYIDQRAENRPNLGGSPDNPIYSMWHMPKSVDFGMMEDYRTNSGLPIIWMKQYSTSEDGSILPPSDFAFAKAPLLSNPYWSENLNTNYDNRRRLIGFVEADIDLKKLLSLSFTLGIKARGGIDYYTDERQRQTASNTYYKMTGLATISLLDSDFTEENYDFLIRGGQRFGNFGFNAYLGGNVMYINQYITQSGSESGMINKEGNYVIQNFNNVVTSQGIAQRELQSLYAFLSFDWNNQFYLDVTARNDWTSVLSPDNESIFYPSVSGSWIVNETFDLGVVVNLLKFRASWAAVGNGGNYTSSRYNVYGTSANQFHGLPYGFIPDRRVNPNLKSEFTVSTEFGANLVMFRSRLNIDLSYYNTETKNQIFTAPLAPSSGYSSGLINAGKISNSGLESQIRGVLLKRSSFEWWAGANITYQWNEVKDLPDDVPVITFGRIEGMTINAQNGLAVGSMQGTAFERDAEGRLILDAGNLPTIMKNESGVNDDHRILGKIYPDWLVGLKTGFTYKGVSLSILADGKLGHNIYSYSNAVGSELGALASTTLGRDEWEVAKEIYNTTGVLPNMGYQIEGSKAGVFGTYSVDPQQYWQKVKGINEMWVYDASYLRLRQLSLSYTFLKVQHGISFLDKISVNASANNLVYLMKKTDNFSPESSSSTGNASGIEIFSMPETMQFIFGVNVSF